MVIDCHGHYTTVSKSVQAFRDAQVAALASGAGTLLSGPEPGAIVIFRDNGSPPYPHIGIVQNDGSIISNSSSRGSFSWVGSPGSYTSYYGRSPEYWRLR